MKYLLLRLSGQWVMWATIVSGIVFLLIYSYIFFDSSNDGSEKWSYYIEPYKNEEDIDYQIEQLKSVDFSNSEYDTEDIETIKSSITILEYLKENHYSYNDIRESICEEMAMDRYSFVGSIIMKCFLFQGIAAIIIIGQIINVGLTTGASVSDYLIHGRKKIYIRETYTTLLVLFVYALLQIVLVYIFSLFVPENSKYLLTYSNDGIRVVTTGQAIIGEGIYLIVQLLVIWAGLYLISRMIDNLLIFSIIGGAYFMIMYYLPGFKNININQILYYSPVQASLYLYILGVIIKLIISAILFQASYICIKHKKIIRLNLS